MLSSAQKTDFLTFLPLPPSSHRHVDADAIPTDPVHRVCCCWEGGKVRGGRVVGRKRKPHFSSALSHPPFSTPHSLPIAYAITAAESLQTCVKLLAPGSSWGGAGGGLSRWIVLFSVLQLAVVQVRSFHELSWVSLIGAAGSLFYIMVAFVGALVRGRAPGVSYGPPTTWTTPSDRVFGTFNALATAAFAYGGHNIACEIQATLPMPPSSLRRMMTSVNLTFFLTAACYFSVAITGFWAFGSSVAPNILTTLSRPVGVIVAANLAVFFHVMGEFGWFDGKTLPARCLHPRQPPTPPHNPLSAGYHIYLFPLIDMADGVALKHGILPSSLLWRLVLRTLFVVGVALIACAVPFFGAVLGFLGATSITPTTFMMPCALWLKLKKPTTKDWRLYFCWATLAVMSVIMVMGVVGAVRDFIKEVLFGHGAKPFEW